MADILDHPNAGGEQPPRKLAKVLPLGCLMKLDLDPDTVLENNKGRFEGLVWAGFDHDGEVIAGSTYADGGTVLWLIEILKRRLMGALDDGED